MLPRHPERLLTLASLLEEDAANPLGAKFDLGFWAVPSDGPNEASWKPEVLGGLDIDAAEITPGSCYFDLPQDKLPAVTCDTTACAMGLAMISKQFEQYGLKTVFYTRQLFDSDGNKAPEIVMLPSCNGREGFSAAVELFGITYEDAQYLFDPDYYDGTPKEAEGELFVAQRIRDFAAGIFDENHHPDYKRDDDDEPEDEAEEEIDNEDDDE